MLNLRRVDEAIIYDVKKVVVDDIVTTSNDDEVILNLAEGIMEE